MRLVPGVDNEASLAWLDGAFEQAFEQRRTQLLAYLEAVMEEVLFETDSYSPDQPRA